MSNPRWAVITAGIQFFVFWWLMSDAAEGRMISVVPGLVMAVSIFLTVEGWLKLDRISRRKVSR